MTTLVERMARAIGAEDRLETTYEERSLRMARAALREIRKPTDGMTMAYGDQFNEEHAIRNAAIWQVMIDAAIAEAEAES